MLPTREGGMEPLAAIDGAPLFAEAWQATVLGLVNALVQEGLLEAVSWSEAFGAALAKAAQDGAPDTQDTYYLTMLETLESVLPEDLTGESLEQRIAAWRAAYERTPHGAPVELSPADQA